ncbi:MAG: PilW family protein [Pyrinomonadaceae bacterium]
MRKSNHQPRAASREQGFSILELVIAMVLFIVVSGAIFGLLRVGHQTRAAVSNNVQLTKSVRLGLNLIGRDTYNAGFGYPLLNAVILRDNRIAAGIGVPVDLNADPDRVPPIIAGNDLTSNTFNTTAGVMTDQVTFLFKDVSFNPVGPAGLEVAKSVNVTANANADVLTLTSPSTSALRVNDLFLVGGRNGGFTLGVATRVVGNTVTFASGDVLGFNNPGPGGEMKTIDPVSMLRVRMVTYFVTSDGTLTRREFLNVPPPGAPMMGYVDVPLVYGVEDFQIKYVQDDGRLVDNPTAGADGILGTPDDDETSLAKVRQVRVRIHARTTELDSRGVPVSIDQTATFATRNLGYEAN